MDEEQPTPEPAPEPAPDPAPEPAPHRSRRRLQVAVALTLIAAVALIGAIQISGVLTNETPVAEQLPARIAVVDTAGVLTTMDDRGGSLVRHPVEGMGLQFPAWSPDGSRIAAIGSDSEAGGVYVFKARDGAGDPGQPTAPAVIYESPESPPFYVYWTPDGRQLTFLTQEPDELALRIAPADGSAPGAVLRQGAPLYWDWAESGRALVNAGAGGPDAFLGEIGLDGVAAGPTATAGVFRSPAVSDDRSHRAYVVAGDGSGSLVVETSAGGERHEIPIAGLAAFGFAPAGKALAFIAPAGPGEQPPDLPIGPLRVVDVATGSVRTILDANVVAFFWSPDGRTIATLRLLTPADDEVASKVAALGGGVGADVVRDDVRLAAAVSGYRLRLVFVDVASAEVTSTKEVRISQLFGLQVLPFFDQYALSHGFWSPDSSSIVLPLVGEDEGVDIVVLPADGSDERRIADGEMGFWSP